MKKLLQNWLLAVGVFLFAWLLVPELEARADYSTTRIFNDSEVEINVSDDNVFNITYNGNSSEVDLSAYNNVLVVWTGGGFYFFMYENPLTLGYYAGGGSLSSSYIYYYNFGSYSSKYSYFSLSGMELVTINHSTGSSGNSSQEHNVVSIPKSDDPVSILIEELQQEIVYTSSDVYFNDQLVFQRPLPTPTPTPSLQQQFQTAVEMTNLEAVMSQVVGLAPLLIGLLTTLIGFSKGLQLLFQTLRRV